MSTDTDLLPSVEDVTFFREHGWYVSPEIVSEQEIETLISASDAYYNGYRDRRLPMVPPNAAYWQSEDGPGFRMNDYVNYEMSAFHNLACHQIITATAALLLGVPQLRVFGTSLTYKPPVANGDSASTGVVGWHTDKAYWKTCTSVDMITAWVPLHDCDAEQGTLIAADGSHYWDQRRAGLGQAEHQEDSTEHFMRLDPETLQKNLRRRAGGEITEVAMNLRRGQVSFHHCLTYHCSYPNRSARPRRACSLHYQDGANRYQPFQLGTGKPLIYNTDHLCRKDDSDLPDYQDPEFFPVVYEAGR